MKLIISAILPFATNILAFATPDHHDYRPSGPFDSVSIPTCLLYSATLTLISQAARHVQGSTL
jgi:hypothetical protein